MLAYILALIIGLGSLALYLAAFFFPEIHRKNDFIWSGVGLFYALVLWVCAGRITGGVLLGQLASVALLGWFGWQTVTLRRALLPADQQTAIPSQGEIQSQLKNLSPDGRLGGLQEKLSGIFRRGKTETAPPPAQTSVETKIERTLNQVAEAVTPTDTTPAPSTSTTPDVEAAPATADSTPDVEATPATADSTPDVEVEDTSNASSGTIEVTATPAEETASLQDATDSESSALQRPNPPDPELVEAAQKSASPDIEKMHEEAESVAGIESAPPAEPPGSGDPEDRKADLEAPVTIEAVPIDPENPPTST